MYRRDHRFDIGCIELWRADAVLQQAPYLLVAPATLVQLDRIEQRAFSIDVDQVDIDARRGCADINQMRRRRCETDQITLEKNWQCNAHIRSMRSAEIGMVVNDHVALGPGRRHGGVDGGYY